jgi:hypothetical protein
LVIDVQQSFEHAPYWSAVDAPAFFGRLQSLLDGAKARQIPIVQIFHVEESGHFSRSSGFIKPFAALRIEPQAVFHKPRHSALIASGLPEWLVEHGIQRLIVSGIRTEQCCETTTRHASDSGFGLKDALVRERGLGPRRMGRTPASQPGLPCASVSMYRRTASTKIISLIRSSIAPPPGRRSRDSATAWRMSAAVQSSVPEFLTCTRRGRVAMSGLKGRASQPRNPHTRLVSVAPSNGCPLATCAVELYSDLERFVRCPEVERKVDRRAHARRARDHVRIALRK